MRPVLSLVIVVLAGLPDGPVRAQSTNFIPRPPPRAYESLAKMHNVPLGAVAKTPDDRQAYVYQPPMGGNLTGLDLGSQQEIAQPVARAREKPRKETTQKAERVTIRELIEGPKEEKGVLAVWDGLAHDVMKQRLDKRGGKPSSGGDEARAEGEKESADADHDAEGSLALRDERGPSLWQKADASGTAGFDAAASRAGSFGSGQPPGRDRPSPADGWDYASAARIDPAGGPAQAPDGFAGPGAYDPARAGQPAVDFSAAGPSANSLFEARMRPDAGAAPLFSSPFDAPTPSPFSQPGATPFSLPGGSLFSREDAYGQPAATPFTPAGAGHAAGDQKKPGTLPW